MSQSPFVSWISLSSIISKLFLGSCFGHIYILFQDYDTSGIVTISEAGLVNIPVIQAHFGKDGSSVK